ncbi:MAG: cytochrome c-type biogenesis protein CcmH [Ardenticatenaceae bacterium]|nr:cytochrome c-type biogenesis protein CcmH [Ardenticatenaceae bacterium]
MVVTQKLNPTPLWLMAIVIGLLALPTIVAAQEITDDDVNRVAQQLFCPTCESVPVDVCPTQVCQDWRSEIRTQLEDGRSDEEILAYFANRYGEGVLANAPTSGIGLVIWIAPVIIVLAGLIVFWRYMNRLQRPQASLNPPSPSDNPDIMARLEEEINNG